MRRTILKAAVATYRVRRDSPQACIRLGWNAYDIYLFTFPLCSKNCVQEATAALRGLITTAHGVRGFSHHAREGNQSTWCNGSIRALVARDGEVQFFPWAIFYFLMCTQQAEGSKLLLTQLRRACGPVALRWDLTVVQSRVGDRGALFTGVWWQPLRPHKHQLRQHQNHQRGLRLQKPLWALQSQAGSSSLFNLYSTWPGRSHPVHGFAWERPEYVLVLGCGGHFGNSTVPWLGFTAIPSNPQMKPPARLGSTLSYDTHQCLQTVHCVHCTKSMCYDLHTRAHLP